MQTQFSIGGMTCANCQNRIERKLRSVAGVEEAAVDYVSGKASVTWNPETVTLAEIKAAVETLDYKVLDETAEHKAKTRIKTAAGTLLIIAALYMLMRNLGIGAASSALPLAQSGMNYGMLFVLGIITSLHCAAMCGGINLSQCLPQGGGVAGAETPQRGEAEARSAAAGGETSPRKPLFIAPILYNFGRVVSYTAVGALAGALGSVVTISGRFQGIVQIIAGLFMIVMGINMLNLFPALRRFAPRMPKIFAGKRDEARFKGRGPLVVGLLNGLMPCGPLQAMQIYALSAGSPVAGGVSMFLFSLGTVPLMFGLGALSSALSGAKGKVFARRVQNAGAVLVTAMGLMMLTYGWSLGGLPVPADAIAGIFEKKDGGAEEIFTPVIKNGAQIIGSTLSSGRYPAITARQGIPVKWTITAPAGSINGCNNRMIIREYGIEHRFTPGENVIEFMPEKAGKFYYSCWMGMIRGSITVIAEGQSAENIAEPNVNPIPAGVTISTDGIALAEIQNENGSSGYQKVAVNLRDDGIEPAVIIVQRNIPTEWIINNNSLDPGNSRLVFPAYHARIDIEQGNNVIQLLPSGDFDFSTADNVFYGYVKVVEDLNNVDIDAVKTEAENFETMIYPDTYFESAQQGGGCCG
jgi:sulfite exporter TauE/SafE/plastocyanin domain-containing protein